MIVTDAAGKSLIFEYVSLASMTHPKVSFLIVKDRKCFLFLEKTQRGISFVNAKSVHNN